MVPSANSHFMLIGSVRFQPEQISAVTDPVSEQQWSVRSISTQDICIHLMWILCTAIQTCLHITYLFAIIP